MSSKHPDTRKIFIACMELNSQEDRARYLDKACKDQPELRQRVEKLIRAHEEAEGFLIGNDTEYDGIMEGPGTVIDRYKLLEEIGEGGFGVVFMAEQTEPIRRRVALKIVKPGMDTKQIIARFEAERQALALMDHPNIAHVFDAGATESGRPYFVMELVHGVPITQYCDDNKLTPEERMKLIIPVCEAIQHAHQKGIIHRDLKPSNILVTLHDGKPVPKVIDFGTAKALLQPLTEKTMFTGYGKLIGTPQYMSPEQAEMSGLDVDTRSDIYSLGVLLYELLTGTTPVDKEQLRAAAFDEMMRMIREEDPPKPSTRISTLGERATDIASHRQVDPQRLRHSLEGDLDWIVMKALEKDRRRRYDSAVALAEDLELHAAGKPISAAPPSLAYRAGKFIRRHPSTYFAAAGVILCVIGLTASVTHYIMTRPKPLARTGEPLLATLYGHEDRIHSMAYAPGKQLLASCSFDGTIKLWSTKTGALVATLDGHGGERVWVVSFFPDEKTLVSTGDDGRILLWDIRRKKVRRVFRESASACLDLGVLPDGRLLAALSSDAQAINIWDLHSGEPVSSIPSLSGPIHHFVFSPEGDKLAYSTTGGGSCDLAMVDFPTGRQRWSIQVSSWQVPSIAFSPDGKTLATGTVKQSVRIWDAETGSLLQELFPNLNHGEWVWSVAYSPDGHWLASKAADMVTIWDAESGLTHADTETHDVNDWGKNLLIFPDGNTLVSGSALRDIRIWDVKATIKEYEKALKEQEMAAKEQETVVKEQEADIALAEFQELASNGKFPELRELILEKASKQSCDPWYWRHIGFAAAYVEDWPTVVASFSRAFELAPTDELDLFNLTIALLQAGDEQEYMKRCHECLALSRTRNDPNTIGIAAGGSMFLPVDNPDFQEACRLVDASVNVSNSPPNAWRMMEKALADYRRGNFESAIHWTEDILAKRADATPTCKAMALYIKAAAHAGKGDVDSALASLNHGDILVRQYRDRVINWMWREWAFVDYLRAEAVKRLTSIYDEKDPTHGIDDTTNLFLFPRPDPTKRRAI